MAPALKSSHWGFQCFERSQAAAKVIHQQQHFLKASFSTKTISIFSRPL
jgi:hypothetical protein